MISPHRIKYHGVESTELNILDLIMCVAFDSDNGETNTFLNREAVVSETYDGRYKRVHSYKYSESFSPKFTFMKKGFGNFTMEEVRQVLKWLTGTDTTALLDVYYDDTNVVAWSAIGGWTEISTYKLANNRTVGIVATFEAVTPYAMSDIDNVTKDTFKEINTTMYYWTSTLVSGSSVPQYLLTFDKVPVVGTEVYSVPSTISGTIITTTPTLYGAISAVNEDDSCAVDDTTFKLTLQGEKTKRTYDNKITINIDTDDNKPVYPRITIQENGIVVPIEPDKTLNLYSDMVPNTVYYNGTTYYWKSDMPALVTGVTEPNYGWSKAIRDTVYSAADTIVEETVYYYTSDQKYRWIDPYTFKSSTTNPNLDTTSVRFTNKHTDFFNKSNTRTSTIVKNNSSNEKVVADGANKIISSSGIRRIFGDDFNWVWLELYDGKNEITVEGNCTVTLEWREVRKVGEY